MFTRRIFGLCFRFHTVSVSVTAVIPFFNASRTIDEAIASIRAQTRQVDEIIIVDDGSRPEEGRALDKHAASCKVIRLAVNGGPSVARNLGIVAARGTWIAFLDADDLWHPEKLARQIAYIEQTPGCRAIHSGVTNVTLDGQESVALKEPVTFESFLDFPCPIFLPTVMMERAALIESGLFDPTKRCCEDLDLWMRFCLKDRFHCIPDPLLFRRVQPSGLSRNNETFWTEADRVYRDFRWLFADQAKVRNTINYLHADFILRALYSRDFKLLGTIVKRLASADAVLPRVAAKVVKGIVSARKNR